MRKPRQDLAAKTITGSVSADFVCHQSWGRNARNQICQVDGNPDHPFCACFCGSVTHFLPVHLRISIDKRRDV